MFLAFERSAFGTAEAPRTCGPGHRLQPPPRSTNAWAGHA